MRARLAALAAGVTLAAAGTASVIASDTDPGPGQPAAAITTIELRAEPAGGAGRAPRLAPGGGGDSAALQYLETDPLTVQAGQTGVVVRGCSRKAPVVNGYFFRKKVFNGFGLTEQGSSPSERKRWAFYLRNDTGAPISGVTFGIVCLRGG